MIKVSLWNAFDAAYHGRVRVECVWVNGEIDDPHYQVGISFFLRKDLNEQIEDIWRMEIEPYLEEYFFDRRDRVERLRWEEVGERILP